jgi:hypothetical protein
MPIYTKPQVNLLVDLINEANPGLNLAPVAVENTRLGLPFNRPLEPGHIGDTSIEIFPRDNSFFIGRVVVGYRRIRLERLFANKVIKFDRWREGNMTVNDLVKWLNDRYNTTFVPSDFVGSSWSSSTSTRTVNIHSNSLCYKGTLSFQWIKGKRALDQIINTNDFAARYWSLLHKNTPTDNRPLLTLTNYGRDFTDFKRNIDMIVNGSVIGNNTSTNHLRILLNRYNKIGMTELTVNKSHTEMFGLAGLTMSRLTIPSSTVTEANGDDYTHALVISSQEDSWFGGRLIFHYNEVLLQVNRQSMFYGDEFEFLLLDSGYDGNLTYYWQLEGDIDRTGVENNGRGQLEFTERTMFRRITIPSTAGIQENAEFKVVIRENSYTGRVVMESDLIRMEDMIGEDRYDWFDVSSLPPEEVGTPTYEVPKGVWKVDVELIAGSGGGGGSQLKTVWDENTGGQGGGGELKTYTFDVKEGDVISWVLGDPGTAGLGGNDALQGGDGLPTIVYLNDIEVGRAKGGGGGRGGSRFEPDRNNDGIDGGVVIGNEGGSGGLPDGQDGQPGQGGSLVLKYRSW